MAVQFRRFAIFVSLSDKHKVPLGESGYPVASVKCGKRVLVSFDKSFLVGDHDFTRSSLTPSVALFIDIPHSMEGSFYHGKVCIDSVFKSSSPMRHGAELSSSIKLQCKSYDVCVHRWWT